MNPTKTSNSNGLRLSGAEPKLSPVEGIKESSRQLRGAIAADLASACGNVSESSKQLLKFHGTYQQEDRDARKNRPKDGSGKSYAFMVRCRIPGGRLTAEQYLALDELADAYANGTLRLTTRQGVQFHGVLKSDLKDTIAGINACLLTTLGACGDVARNVMACPAPVADCVHRQLQETAALLAAQLAPRTRAYHEIWLDGEPLEPENRAPDAEPLYGKTYLPRKFKTALALPEDNCVDVYTQDLGLLAVVEHGEVVGFDLLAGGGMGMTHGNELTFPHLAKPICYVPLPGVVAAAEAVVRLFRDHGNRSDRKRARLKYLVAEWGVEHFREVLAEYLGATPLPPRGVRAGGFDLHVGWTSQGDGRSFYGLSIQNGRVKDDGGFRLRSALRTLVGTLRPELRVTPQQDLLLCGLPEQARDEVERRLAEHGVLRPEQVSTVRRFSMACPATPTCGLAITESERVLPGVIDRLEGELKRLGLEAEPITVRMTGCPNGCARPYQSDIGLVGRSGDKYTLFVGGHAEGTRLNFVLKDLVPLAEIVPTLVPLLEHFKAERLADEGFGDFCQRQGVDRLREWLPQAELHPTAHGEVRANGHGSGRVNEHQKPDAIGRGLSLLQLDTERLTSGPSLSELAAQAVSIEIRAPDANGVAPPQMRSETLFAGAAGGERPDYAYRYDSSGRVAVTVVYFYGDDRRAAEASPDDALRREAVYRGRVDAFRLFAARKVSDTLFIGEPGEERRDLRRDYHADGRVARTVVFFYEDGVRAAEAAPGAALRRETAYDGAAERAAAAPSAVPA